ncbi:hypothetical protein F5X71_34550 [Nocardia brasiliensis]|uniref:Uncharacterized protein n=1 Tax=Nocardia brasiliensis TaxID=37326 RepID=A0A6G9Y0L9_NOCBR|nr:hypothetical protein [Nocardia brasiliensis]QIS06748.1 hypothetical protein F5X71_34550 [Nocardia brasiliensis]
MKARLLRLAQMEPALVRSVLVAISAVVAVVLGRAVDVSWIDTTVTIYGIVAPIVAGWFIRGAVIAPKAHAERAALR